jgi:hypothetical protein
MLQNFTMLMNGLKLCFLLRMTSGIIMAMQHMKILPRYQNKAEKGKQGKTYVLPQ